MATSKIAARFAVTQSPHFAPAVIPKADEFEAAPTSIFEAQMSDQLLSEKKLDSLCMPSSLRMGPTLAQAIRELADSEVRTIQQQILVLLAKGLKHYRCDSGRGTEVL